MSELLMNYRALIVVVFGGEGGNLSNASCTASSGQSIQRKVTFITTALKGSF